MTSSPRVVYHDDDPAMRRAVRALLDVDEVAVVAVGDVDAARAAAGEDPPPACVVTCDPAALDSLAATVPDRPLLLFADDPTARDGVVTVDRRGDDALARLRTAVGRATAGRGEASAVELRTVAAALQDPIYVLDEAGRFARVNDAFVDLVGHPRDRIVGSHVSLVKEEAAVAAGEDALRRLRDDPDLDGLRFEIDLVAADGTVRRCEDHVALLPSPDGAFAGSAGVLRDVTERHERERRLRRERDRVRLLFDRSPVPIVRFSLDDDTLVLEETNPAFDLTFGVGDAEAGTPVDDLHVPDDEDAVERAARINRRVRAGDPVEAEVTRETADGRRQFLVHVATAVAEGEVEEGYAIYVDVTEQAAYEETLARQTRWLEGFADVFTHDLSGPLNAAQGNLDLAREALSGGDEATTDRLDATERALDRLAELVRDLSDALRAGTVDVDPEPVDLGSLAREVWASLDADGATLDAADAPRVVADRLALKRLLENLFRNALDHAGPGVTVHVRPVRGGFCVDDDGPGVPEGERESVFAPGYTTAADGSGFGLLSVRQIALAHDWSVAVRDSPAGGARFAVTGVETA
jgi:PAS domain S-box-containing protein